MLVTIFRGSKMRSQLVQGCKIGDVKILLSWTLGILPNTFIAMNMAMVDMAMVDMAMVDMAMVDMTMVDMTMVDMTMSKLMIMSMQNVTFG